ncbi:MAG: hypothetical protein ACU85V_09955, partial [Gammaproteobacteria bacterium]
KFLVALNPPKRPGVCDDDGGELRLSTDADPNNATMIARVVGWTGPREWDNTPAQKSEPVTLQAGRKYYLEALQKEGSGGDNVAVAWQPPGGGPRGERRRADRCTLAPAGIDARLARQADRTADQGVYTSPA